MLNNMDDFLKNNWFKIGILVGIFVLAYTVYYSLVLQPANLESKRQALEAQQRFEQELKKESDKRSLDSCLAAARIDYDLNWANACKANSNRIKTGYDNCMESGLNSTSCRSIWGTPNPSDNCSLPDAQAVTINGYLEKAKEDCYRRYPIY